MWERQGQPRSTGTRSREGGETTPPPRLKFGTLPALEQWNLPVRRQVHIPAPQRAQSTNEENPGGQGRQAPGKRQVQEHQQEPKEPLAKEPLRLEPYQGRPQRKQAEW